MQIQDGIEKLVIFVSHVLSDQVIPTRLGIMELELYACLVYLASSSVPKLVRQRVILSEYRFLIEHIPGAQNVVVDGLTRVSRSEFIKISKDKRHLFKNDSAERSFGEEKKGWSRLKERSRKRPSWRVFHIPEDQVPTAPEWEDEVEHHLYSLPPLTSLSVDTLGPLKEEENGNSFVIVIVDNFSKLIGLYPAKSTTSKEFHKFTSPMDINFWCSEGDPKRWRLAVYVQDGSGHSFLTLL